MKKIIVICLFMSANPLLLKAQYNVKCFGARGDGASLDTRSIQRAIDSAYEHGGGEIDIPAGTYKIGTLILKDNIDLHLLPGAVLMGSPDDNDYTEVHQLYGSRTKNLYAKYFMIFAQGAKNISITGSGIINGNGLNNFKKTYPQNLRPCMIRLVNCQQVTIRGVQLLESANWTLHLLGCRDVTINGIVIETHGEGNRDGLDIDASQNIRVANSRFLTTDDAIVMKATNDTLCQDITITNCILSSKGSAIKTGTESNGGFRNITVSNCVIKNVPVYAGIALMTVDGGLMQNILLENIAMEDVATPFFIKLGIRERPFKEGQYEHKIGNVTGIHLDNISVVNAKFPSVIMGLYYKKLRDITVNNFTVRYIGTQASVPYNKVPFKGFSYPMAGMFKNLPAYGLYCRNVEGIHLQNVCMYSTENERRAALVFDQVNGLELLSVKANIKNNEAPMIYFRNTSNVVAAFCKSLDNNKMLFAVEKNIGSSFSLSDNILRTGQKDIVKVPALLNAQYFDEFEADNKYSINDGEKIDGLHSYKLREGPLKISMKIADSTYPQLCLLILNSSSRPEKVAVKYEGITQEFLVDWNKWGWAPVSLLKRFAKGKLVTFEIKAESSNTQLKIAKVYLRYQDLGYTD